MRFTFVVNDSDLINALKACIGGSINYDLETNVPYFVVNEMEDLEKIIACCPNGVIIQSAQHHEPKFKGFYIAAN